MSASSSKQAEKLEWPYCCKYFNPMTMHGPTLQDLKENLLYEGNTLAYIKYKDGQISGDLSLDLSSSKSREDFAKNLSKTDPDITIFFMSHIYQHRHSSDGQNGDIRFTISMEEETWTWMLEEFHIHPKFVESLYYFLGNFSTFVSYSEDGASAETFHLIVKVFPAGHLEAAFYIRYNFKTKKLFAIVAGNDLNGHVEYLIEQIVQLKDSWHPFGIAFSIVSRYFFYLEWQRRQLDHSVIMMERVTGRGAIAYSEAKAAQPDNPDTFNLRNMHWIGGNQRNMIYAMQYQIRLTTFLCEAHLQFVAITVNKSDQLRLLVQDMPVKDRLLQEAFKAHLETCKGVFEDSQVIGERAQSQLNAADSIINTLIAKQSQRTADESKNIAVETRRDSTSMKTIAGLTMVYLPSTFVATIFSTGFFSFDSGTGPGPLMINRDIWKLVCVSLLFTVATVVVWIYLNHNGIPKLMRKIDRKQNVAQSPVEPPVILLDLPQVPGHRARRRANNDTVEEDKSAGNEQQTPDNKKSKESRENQDASGSIEVADQTNPGGETTSKRKSTASSSGQSRGFDRGDEMV